jgi:hypothetical protein
MKPFQKKAIILSAILIAGGLLAILFLVHPVHRTTLRIPAATEFDQQVLADRFRAMEGVFGLRLDSAAGILIVDHCPELEPRQLVEVFSSFGGAVALESGRILPIHTLFFPPGGGESTMEPACHQTPSCPAGASWRKLLTRRCRAE